MALYLREADLRRRGWTERELRLYLGQPDGHIPVYDAKRVEHLEQLIDGQARSDQGSRP